MTKPYAKSLFIFRRDLRLFDNQGLNAARLCSEQVLVCFIFDPRQIDRHPYQSQPGLQFMLESLEDLQQQLAAASTPLQLFSDFPENVISSMQRQGIDAVFVNRDYTPFSRLRDAGIQQHCQSLGINFHSHADALLNEPEQVVKTDATPYQVFTAFYSRSRQHPVNLPADLSAGCFVTNCQQGNVALISSLKKPHHNTLSGGRAVALAKLGDLPRCRDYTRQRDFPALAAGSDWSAYLKFGCLSIREAYYAVVNVLGDEHPLLRQLYWRDFFHHIAWHFPHVFGHAFHRRYDALVWRNNLDEFQAWAEGRTGFPIVDAGMRQLKQSGCMHNRVRMIVASFLVKDLHISWRWGERYFAQQLLDYDPCLNNGNWQWAASTGCDAQPYFRIFNPWLQQQKFDPECLYIKQWIPELRSFSPTVIHQWHKKPLAGDYPAPMVDHAVQSLQAKALFKNLDQPALKR